MLLYMYLERNSKNFFYILDPFEYKNQEIIEKKILDFSPIGIYF